MEIYDDKFLPVDSFVRIFALVSIAVLTFLLTFIVVPFAQWQLHFFQLGIFLSAILFGPFVGALVGALSSSYNGMFIIHNPWIIGGNALLGFFTAYLYTKTTPFKAAMGAYAIQLPYLLATDVLFAGMPLMVVAGLVATLFFENIICAFVAVSMAPHMRALISRS
jgi:uncharacterized membrane protein